jgi:hypothetical protein
MITLNDVIKNLQEAVEKDFMLGERQCFEIYSNMDELITELVLPITRINDNTNTIIYVGKADKPDLYNK